MATLKFQFYGTCVHMTTFRPYRVIIPAGRVPATGYTLSPSVTIQGLESLGTLQRQPNGSFALQGARFTIGTMTAGGPDVAVNLPCVPHLSQIWPEMALNTGVVFDQAMNAGAYFDFLNAKVVGFKGQGPSAYATVTVEVPDPATIQMTSWNEGGLMNVTTVTVPNPEEPIGINNLPLPGSTSNDPAEYATNFLVADPFPTGDTLEILKVEIAVALDLMVNCLGRTETAETFPSCSNSQWP